MKRQSFKEWLHESDEDGATGEMVVVWSFLIPIISTILDSINSSGFRWQVLVVSFIVQIVYVLLFYLFDSKYKC